MRYSSSAEDLVKQSAGLGENGAGDPERSLREALESSFCLGAVEVATGRGPESDGDRAVRLETSQAADHTRFGVIGIAAR